MDTMTGKKRTDYCGTFTSADIGRKVTVAGWVQRQRDLGALIFIDLRDRSGIVQLAFDDTTDKEIFEKAFSARSEFVLMASGTVRERSSKNMDIPTGEIEIFVDDLRVLAKSETTPFEIVENCSTSELTRLKYRYLDLRRPDLQKNILIVTKSQKSHVTILMKTDLSKSKPPCSSNQLPRVHVTSSFPAESIKEHFTHFLSHLSFTNSFQW